MTILINGDPGDSVSVLDRGFQYGDGLFETIAVAAGTPLLWDRHIQRLFLGAGRLKINTPPENQLRHEAEQVCQGVARGVLKVVLTRGISSRGYAPVAESMPTRTVSLSPWPDYPPQHRTLGVNVQFCHTMLGRNGALAGLKHLNRLEQVLARGELANDCVEGLMRDELGQVIEGTMTNVFMVARGNLFTPDLSYCGVEGVMRGLVLERAAALMIPFHVKTLAREDIYSADEVFLTNSLIGLWPVRRIESHEYSPGKITKKIQEVIGDACRVD